ncbi:MAG: hypothetical protein AAB633_03280 [Patescibacteria group bacterium]
MEQFVLGDVWQALGFLVFMTVVGAGSVLFTLVEVGRLLQEEEREAPHVG